MRFLKIIISFLFITALTMPALAATHQETSQQIKFVFNTKDLKELDAGDTVSVFYHLILANSTLATNTQTHKNENNLLETFFTKDLFKTYARVKKMDDNYFQAKGEEGCINFDAITGGQDVPYGFYIDADGKNKSKMATINVNLKYSNNAVIVLHLLKTESGWKIDDINYPNKGSLRSKLQECLNNPKYSRYLRRCDFYIFTFPIFIIGAPMQTQYIRDMLINIFIYLPQSEILKYLPHPEIFTDAIAQLRRIEPPAENTGLHDIYLKSELVNIATTSVLHSKLLGPRKPLPSLIKILLSLIYNETVYEELVRLFFPDDEILSFEKLTKLPEEALRQYCENNRIKEIRIFNDLQALQKVTVTFIQRYTDLKRTEQLPKLDSLQPAVKKASSDVKLDIDVDQDQDKEITITSKTKNKKIGTTALAVCIGYYILGVKKTKQKAIVGHFSSRIGEMYQEAKESLIQDNFRIVKTFLTGGYISNMVEFLPLLCEPDKHPEIQDVMLGQPHGGTTAFHIETRQPKQIYHANKILGMSETQKQEEKEERPTIRIWYGDGLIDSINTQTPYFNIGWPIVSSGKLTLTSAAEVEADWESTEIDSIPKSTHSSEGQLDTIMNDVFPSPISQPSTSQPSPATVAQPPASPPMTQAEPVTLMDTDTEQTPIHRP